MLPHWLAQCAGHRSITLNHTHSNYCFALTKLRDKNLPQRQEMTFKTRTGPMPKRVDTGDTGTYKRVSPEAPERAVPLKEVAALFAPPAQSKKAAGPWVCPDKTHSWKHDVRG
jgi:hypothetical protein